MKDMKIHHYILTAILALAAAAGSCISAQAGYWAWLADYSWVYWEDNTRLTGWHWIDGNGDGTAECYYFDPNGKLITGTSVDGWEVNKDGAWVSGGVVQTQQVTPGTHYPAGSGNASGSGSSGFDGVHYTPAIARQQHVSLTVMGTPPPYRGKVWSSDDYYIIKSEAKAGQISYTMRCMASGCYNPQIDGGQYCGVHTCKEPGCTSGVALSVYNAGFCYTHMKAHGIDEYEFTKLENEQQKAARAAQAAQQAAGYGSGSGSSRSSGSSTSSGSKNSNSSGYSSNTSGSGGSSGSGSKSSGSKSGVTTYDAYDEGYDDVYYNEEYDADRYTRDWDYMSGVDDAMEDLGEDW